VKYTLERKWSLEHELHNDTIRIQVIRRDENGYHTIARDLTLTFPTNDEGTELAYALRVALTALEQVR